MRLFLFYIFFLLSNLITGQQLSNILFTNGNANSQVLSLDIKPAYAGNYFIVGIVKQKELVGYTDFFARAGKHNYEVRTIEGWNGSFDFVATSLPKEAIVTKALKKATILDEFDMLFRADGFSPRLINFSKPITFLGYPFVFMLFLFAILIFALFKWVGKKTYVTAIFAGFLFAFIARDVLSINEQWRLANLIEAQNFHLNPIGPAQQFIVKAKPLITGNWTYEGKFSDEYYQLYFKYMLADLPYVWNLKNFDLAAGTFVITEKPEEDQEVLVEENGFYLAQKR